MATKAFETKVSFAFKTLMECTMKDKNENDVTFESDVLMRVLFRRSIKSLST